MNYLQFCKLIILFVVLTLTACSTTQQAYLQNLQFYFAGQKNVELTKQDVISSPVDLIYVKNGDRPYATMALAFIENEQYKWLSKDNVMFITQKGRLVQTLGLSENLVYTSNIDTDFLKNWFAKRGNAVSWERLIDIQLQERDDFGAKLLSSIKIDENVNIKIQDTAYSTYHIVETVYYESVLSGKASWNNEFWFERESQQLLKSSQVITPQMDSVEIVYLSRAARLKRSKTISNMLGTNGVEE